jgi:hypothetical protein
MNRNKLKYLIDILVENVLREQEDKPAEDLSAPDDAGGLDLGGSDPATPEGGDTTDPAGGDMDIPAGEESDTPGEGDSGGGLDLGGGGFSGGGGGFSGGSSSSGSDDSTSSDDADNKGTVERPEQMTQDATPEDPIKSTIDMAIELSGLTGRSQDITNAVKHNIQNYFSQPEEAVEIVQGLWDTNDPKLRSVAYKILMFIKGE